MKIILSKKGLDSSNCSHGINFFEGEEMLYIPIPALNEKDFYIDFKNYHNHKSLLETIKKYTNDGRLIFQIPIDELNKNFQLGCHLDPQLKNYFSEEYNEDFRGCFGQVNQAEYYLENNNVEVEDIFMFFSRYYDVKLRQEKHIIYGYMQVGDIIKINSDNTITCSLGKNLNRCDVESKYPFIKNHPHWKNYQIYSKNAKNTIYIAKENCDFRDDNGKLIKGFGIFKYDKSLDLTSKEAKNKSDWCVPLLRNCVVEYKKSNDEKYKFDDEGKIKIAIGYGQEFVIREGAEHWAKTLIKNIDKI